MLTPVYNPPRQRNLFNSASSAGSYDLAAALSDIIDNSITAKARTIDVYIEFDYHCLQNSWIAITDDGSGMSYDELKDNMRLASEDPEAERENHDLGRFGFGMKSASLSQGRTLTVITRKKGHDTAVAVWDKDSQEDEWMMPMAEGAAAEALLKRPLESKSGTQIIWSNLAHVTEDYELSTEDLSKIQHDAIEELRLTYHRLMDEGRIISVNGKQLKPRDPFAKAIPAESATQIPYQKAKIIFRAYNLQHFGKMTNSQEDDLGGPEGLMRNQGFYVYRNKRLIIHGTWFGIVKHSPAYQLSRIQLDIPNSLDRYWKISIDKKSAQLPQKLRNRLRGLVLDNNKLSSIVIGGKHTKGPFGNEKVSIWHQQTSGGITKFILNKDHSLIQTLIKSEDEEIRQRMALLITLIESTLPLEDIRTLIENSRNRVIQPEIESEQLTQTLTIALEFLADQGMGYPQLLEMISTEVPFVNSKPRAIEILDSIFNSE